MDRPHAAAERRSADAARQVARIRAGFAATQSRRAAAARRRGALAAILLVTTSAGWAGAGFAFVGWYVAVVPTVLLVVTLVAGRAAVISGTATDERWHQLIDNAERHAAKARTGALRTVVPRSGTGHVVRTNQVPQPRTATGSTRPRVDVPTTAVASGPVGRAVRPSDRVTDVFDVIVADRGETSGSMRHASAPNPVVRPEPVDDPAGHDWEPVDVPPPAYTLKPAVPRPEPAPLDAPASAELATTDPADDPDDEPEPSTSGSIDLDAVLERRRASGL